MLPHPTYDRLIALGLVGMAKAFEEQRQQPAVASLMFEERVGLLVDREAVERESRRLVTRLKFANLRQTATIEDLNTKAARGLDKALFAKLATGDWIGRRHDLLITGKTGTGKSWLACALGHKACRDDRSVLYYRVPRLLDALALARGDGRYVRLLKSLARVELLILDDWGLAPLTSQQGRDLLEIVDDRHGCRSTIVTSQLPVDHWHEVIVESVSGLQANRPVSDCHLDGSSPRSRSASARILLPTAVDIGPSIRRILKNIANPRTIGFPPDNIVRGRPEDRSDRQRQSACAQETHDTARALQLPELGKNEEQTCLHFLVGIEDDHAGSVMSKPGGQWQA